MQAIRAKGNKSTELKMVKLFRENKITGWRRHLPLPGKPDFTFRKEKLTLFVDGCFGTVALSATASQKQTRTFGGIK